MKISQVADNACEFVTGLLAEQLNTTPEMVGFDIFQLDMTEGIDPQWYLRDNAASLPLVPRKAGMKPSERFLWRYTPTSKDKLAVMDADKKPIQFDLDGNIVSGDPRRLARLAQLVALYDGTTATSEGSYVHPCDEYKLGIGWVKQYAKLTGELPLFEVDDE